MSFSRRLRAILLVLTCVLASASLFKVNVQASPITWIIETVDASVYVGSFSSIAIDSDGFPHIAYYDNNWDNLKYATPSRVSGPKWVITPVDTVGDVGYRPSIALDSNDNPHISYIDRTNVPDRDLKYAKCISGQTWTIETVVSTDWLNDCSLVLDSNDNPHISYYDGLNADLKYASWDGVVWFIETVDSTGDVGSSNSLVLDSNGISHISYYDVGNKHLKYAYWTGTMWSTETVDASTNVGQYYTSIALDSSDNPHISYFDGLNLNLKYASWNGSAWSIETVDASADVGLGTSLALDWLDRPHIAYFDRYWENLKYARLFGENWVIEVVDQAENVGWQPSLALDSEGKPHISYLDRKNLNLKYASTSDEYFTTVNVTPFDSDSDGQNDAVKAQMDVDTSYSGTVPVQVYAFLVDTFGYNAALNYTSWSITGQVVDWMHPNASVTLYVPPGYLEGPSTYWVMLNLFDEDGLLEDSYEETNIYLYPSSSVTPPPTAFIESCNSTGVQQDVFELGETLYVTGSGFPPSTGCQLYVVADQETWTDGMTIPERVPGTEPYIAFNSGGEIDPTDIWHDPQTAGSYDIIVDVNDNGQYDIRVDMLDDSDVELTAGLSIIPELSAILPVFMIATFAMAILLRRKHVHE